MDYNQNQQQNRNQVPYQSQGNIYPYPGQTYALIAMILGAACLFTFFTIYIPLVLGSLAIIFAILSKGYGKKMLLTAKIGFLSAICALMVLLSVMGTLVAFVISSDRATLIDTGRVLDQQIEQQVGADTETLFGTSYEEIMEQYADMLGK